jgi:hypothetical protein
MLVIFVGLQQSSVDITKDRNASQFDSDNEESGVQWDDCYKKFEDFIPGNDQLSIITFYLQMQVFF